MHLRNIESNHSCAVVALHQRFPSAVGAAGLGAVWLIAGEEKAYSAGSTRDGFGGRLMNLMA